MHSSSCLLHGQFESRAHWWRSCWSCILVLGFGTPDWSGAVPRVWVRSGLMTSLDAVLRGLLLGWMMCMERNWGWTWAWYRCYDRWVAVPVFALFPWFCQYRMQCWSYYKHYSIGTAGANGYLKVSKYHWTTFGHDHRNSLFEGLTMTWHNLSFLIG